MFEKEAEEFTYKHVLPIQQLSETDLYYAFKDGAEYGYNKANEWHFVKDKLPPSGETVLLYLGTNFIGNAVTCTGCVDCKGNWYKNVYGEPIKWQEIVLPKEIE